MTNNRKKRQTKRQAKQEAKRVKMAAAGSPHNAPPAPNFEAESAGPSDDNLKSTTSSSSTEKSPPVLSNVENIDVNMAAATNLNTIPKGVLLHIVNNLPRELVEKTIGKTMETILLLTITLKRSF
jgi:hypothetical protein